MKHAANCKECGKGLVLDAHDDCPQITIEKWLPIIVCNRCGDYLAQRVRLTEGIQHVCNRVNTAMQAGMRNLPEVKSAASEKLTQFTRKFVALLCNHWHTTNDWDVEMVNLIVEHPDRATVMLKAHEGAHRRAREKADREWKDQTPSYRSG